MTRSSPFEELKRQVEQDDEVLLHMIGVLKNGREFSMRPLKMVETLQRMHDDHVAHLVRT